MPDSSLPGAAMPEGSKTFREILADQAAERLSAIAPEPEPQATYAVVELMGHVTIIGAISESALAGAPALRIDRLDGRPQHVWPQSLYRVTEVSEEEARALWERQQRSHVTGLPPSLAYHVTSAARALEAAADPDPWAGDPLAGEADDDEDPF